MAVELVREGCFAGGWGGGYLDDADGVEEVCEFGDGGEAVDFAQPGSEISEYLHENGYNFGPSAVEDDFYDSGFAHGRFEEEIAENEMKRRMMMEESAINLEVDLSSLGLDEKLDVSGYSMCRFF